MAERRRQVAELTLKENLGTYEIAKRLGMDNPSGYAKISQDKKWLREQWAQSGIRCLDEHKGRLVAEISLAKHEAWNAWKKSIAPYIDPDTGLSVEREGNPKFLSIVINCIKREADILGLTTPQVVQMMAVQQNAAQVGVTLSDQEINDAMINMLRSAARQGSPGAQQVMEDFAREQKSLPCGLKEIPPAGVPMEAAKEQEAPPDPWAIVNGNGA